MFTNQSLSAADLAAITKNGSGWGDSNGVWWLILLFLFIGNNGWNNGGVTNGYTLASDFANIQRQIDTTATATQNAIYQNADQLQRQVTAIGNGVSSLGYDQLAQMNNLGTQIANQGYMTRDAINQQTIAGMQNANALQSQMATCCCDQKSRIADLNYNLATQVNGLQSAMQSGFCQTNYNNSTNTRDIVDANAANTQAILAKLNQMESNAQQDKITALQMENNNLKMLQSQADQNAYLISKLSPTPIPAYMATGYGCGCACS